MFKSEYTIPLKNDITGQTSKLTIYAESVEQNTLVLIDEQEADENCEAAVQLKEGCSYRYRLSKNLSFNKLPGIIKGLPYNNSEGGITPGIYTGTLQLEILDSQNNHFCFCPLEVQSVKTTYREDYRFMLQDIAEQCTDLLMLYSSPVSQSFSPDVDADPQTIYQQFAFVKSIVDSEEFNEAVNRIISNPVKGWFSIDEETDIRRIKKLGSSQIRQIISGQNRCMIPENHPLHEKLKSIPAHILITRKTETVDIPENRFIKHVLEVFNSFCTDVKNNLIKKENSNFRACKEAVQLEERLSLLLNQSFFRRISPPDSLPLHSPVLQRKEGYRRILRIWLMFYLAAKLEWKGGEDVYSAGKRDIAVLYEYWLFFKLLDLMKDIFKIEPESLDNLIDKTSDGMGLKLKSGIYTPLKGIYRNEVRNLNIEFSYNRTFSGEKDYPQGGSWSKSMRPDYTLSIWPEGIKVWDAEEQELIVHLHFDAKYRVEGLKEILGDDDVIHDEEKEEQRRGTYKRADLLKMHAYKDAIRRTGGAYVLYPGKNNKTIKGFHEIIPGLGAFAIRPSINDDGSEKLKLFIHDIVKHFLNRASQRDRLSYRTYDIHKKLDDPKISERMPEYHAGVRSSPPADTFILVGYCRNEAHYNWIMENGLYNFRLKSRRGSLKLSPETAGASFLLIHFEGRLKTGEMYRIIEKGPGVFSRDELIEKGYKDPKGKNYLLYKIEKEVCREFAGALWDISKLEKFKRGRGSGLPFSVSLSELMKVKVK